MLEVAETVLNELHNREETVKKIAAKTALSTVEYKKAIAREVIRGITAEIRCAFFSNTGGSPDTVKNNALQLLQRKLDRDLRVYAEH